MEQRRPNKEFGKRGPIAPQPAVPPKRSHHVALLLMGTFAVGGGAYALMPRENCQPPSPGMAAPAVPQAGTDCAQRGSTSSGGHGGSGSSWSRTSFFSSDSSSSSRASSGPSSDSGSSGVTRGGFGSFARAFSGHFSMGS
ncbi:MAG TPA: hypothetical protein VGD75_10285 [Bradyrhizobium sp.]